MDMHFKGNEYRNIVTLYFILGALFGVALSTAGLLVLLAAGIR